jgi:hypothetical protein
MRWRFVDPKNRPEAAAREAVTVRIDSRWREFQCKTDKLSALFAQRAKWDLPGWMDQHLQGIDSNLMWEFGPAVRAPGHRLVITPESAHQLRPLVRAILDRAPIIVGWEFYDYRLAEDLESTRLTVEGRTGCSLADFSARATIGERHRIDLSYTSPSIVAPEDARARNAALVATETLLGEECLNHWIGAIEITTAPRGKGLKQLLGRSAAKTPHFYGLDRLSDTVKALIGQMRDQLPASPHCEWVDGAQWSIWKLKPEKADDYCGQLDLFVGKSANPAQWNAAHSGGLFHSERFSRCGETFCYVKLDGSQGLDDESFADKSEIEDALDEALKAEKLGCHIGGGTGLRYSYIDLALTDVDHGIHVVRERLQAGKVPNRSWIQFFDSDLAAEWVGVYDDSPPPPMEFGS